MPFFSTFGELLTNLAMAAGFDAWLGQWIAPAEARRKAGSVKHRVLVAISQAAVASAVVEVLRLDPRYEVALATELSARATSWRPDRAPAMAAKGRFSTLLPGQAIKN